MDLYEPSMNTEATELDSSNSIIVDISDDNFDIVLADFEPLFDASTKDTKVKETLKQKDPQRSIDNSSGPNVPVMEKKISIKKTAFEVPEGLSKSTGTEDTTNPQHPEISSDDLIDQSKAGKNPKTLSYTFSSINLSASYQVSGSGRNSRDISKATKSEHDIGWQLRMLTSRTDNADDDEGHDPDSDLSLSELSNAIRSAMSDFLQDPDWVERLQEFRADLNVRKRGLVTVDDFRRLMKHFFDISLGDKFLGRIFDSFDSSRNGRVPWQTVMDYLTPLTRGELVHTTCGNVVNCIALSADNRVIGFGGINFFGAVSVSTREDLFRQHSSEMVTAVALNSDASSIFVGRYCSQNDIVSKVHEYHLDDVKSKDLDCPIAHSFEYAGDVECISLSPDNMTLAIGGHDKTVVVYFIPDGQLLLRILYPTTIRSVAITRPIEFSIELAFPIKGEELIIKDWQNIQTLPRSDNSSIAECKTCTDSFDGLSDPLNGILFATIGPSADLLSSALRESIGSIPLENDMRHRTSTSSAADALVFPTTGSTQSIVLFLARVRTPSKRVGLKRRTFVTLEDEDQFLFDVPINGAIEDGISIEEWGHWLDDPSALCRSIASFNFGFFSEEECDDVPNVELTSISSPSSTRSLDLQIGAKVVVAVAARLLTQIRRFVLAMGGDSGSLIVARWSRTTDYTASDGLTLASEEREEEAKKTSTTEETSRHKRSRGSIAMSLASTALRDFLEGFDARHGTLTRSDISEMSRDGGTVAVGGQSSQVFVVRTPRHETVEDEISTHFFCDVVQRFNLKGSIIYGVSLSGDGTRIAVGGSEKNIYVLDVKTGCELFAAAVSDRIRSVTLSHNGQIVGFGGTSVHTYPAPDIVRCVSVSDDGLRLAMGREDKLLIVFDTETKSCIRSWLHSNKVWSVKLSKGGEFVVAGDNAGWVILRNVDDGSTTFEHQFVASKGEVCYVWTVALSPDSTVLAAGSWTGEVCVWKKEKSDPEAGDTWRRLLEGLTAIKRTDRVYSISLAHSVSLLAVGDRSGHATIFRLPLFDKDAKSSGPKNASKGAFVAGEIAIVVKQGSSKYGKKVVVIDGDWNKMIRVKMDEDIKSFHPHELEKAKDSAEIVLEVKFPNRVYSVAISSDGSLFAIGGAHNQVWLYSVPKARRLHTFFCDVSIQTVALTILPSSGVSRMNGKVNFEYALGIGGEDKAVNAFACGNNGRDDDEGDDGEESAFARLAKFSLRLDVNSFAFSNDSIVIASGKKVVVVGTSGGLASWRDRPDFERMADLMDGDTVALNTVLDRFPSVANICHPGSGEAMLQRAVRLHTNDALMALLSVKSVQMGFVHDKHSRTALLTALLMEKRVSTDLLIKAIISGRVSSMPSALASVTECFTTISKIFPPLFLDLICGMQLEKEPEIIAPVGTSRDSRNRAVFARMKDGEVLVRGSELQAGPNTLWKDVCVDSASVLSQRTVQQSQKYAKNVVNRQQSIDALPSDESSWQRALAPRMISRPLRSLSKSLLRSNSSTSSQQARSSSWAARSFVSQRSSLSTSDVEGDQDWESLSVPSRSLASSWLSASSKSWRSNNPKKTPKIQNLDNFLKSPSWVVFILILVAAQAAVTLTKNPGGWYALTYIVSAIFFVEINLRFYASRVLENAYLPFFKELSNLADLSVVLIDIVFFILSVLVSSEESSASGTTTFIRYIRTAKLLLSIRAFRLAYLFRAIRFIALMHGSNSMTPNEIHKRAEVSAFRVPFENFSGYYEDLDDAPLNLVNCAAHKLRRLDVYDSPIVLAVIDFKWNKYARRLFYGQFFFFLSFLLCVITFGVLASRTAASTAPDLQSIVNNSSIPDYYPSAASLTTCSDGIGALVIFPFIVASCLLFLGNELQQFINIGPSSYFKSTWNYLDLAGFGLELVAAGSWLARADEHAIRGLLAVSSLLLLIKTLYFARGFAQWGPLVRTLASIIDDVRPFLLILCIFVSSFAVAFVVFNTNERQPGSKRGNLAHGTDGEMGSWAILEAYLFVLYIAVFGEKSGYTATGGGSSEKVPLRLPTNVMNDFLYVTMMVIVNIILLNLLIAIMANSYSRVQKYAHREAIYERSTIILEMEQSMLPLVTTLNEWSFFATSRYNNLVSRVYKYFASFSRDVNVEPGVISAHQITTKDLKEEWLSRMLAERDSNFPRWLHLLKTNSGQDVRSSTGVDS